MSYERDRKYRDGQNTRPLPSRNEIDVLDSVVEAQEARKGVIARYVRIELKRMAQMMTPYPDKGFITICESKQNECLVDAQRYNIAPAFVQQQAAQDVAVIVQKADEKRIAANRKSEKSRKEFFKAAFEEFYGRGVRY